jgi:hypothetical protein
VRSILATVLTAALATGVATTAVPPSSARQAGHTASRAPDVVKVHRGGPDRTVTFHRGHGGEVFWNVIVSARGVSWADRGNESAVVSAYVDGHYTTDVVITSSSRVKRQFALGRLGEGRHTLRLHYATKRSPSDAGVAAFRHVGFTTVRRSSTAYAAARYAPVLYGRAVKSRGGPFQNNHTDTPLLAWHQTTPAAKPGHSIIEYSVLWSNEDGGTATRALMAQWGRTTDIEWVYRVEVNARGKRVAGSGVFQAAGHGTKTFHGKYDGTHPLLQTCTDNNNVCDKVTDPMRFALSTRDVLPASQPREHEMDTHPWTYQVMAHEIIREHKKAEIGDQRRYLYIALNHDTSPAASASNIGLSVEVKLFGDDTMYKSNRGVPFLSILRNGPAATTVKLPRGTTVSDIEEIDAYRVVAGTEDEATLTLTDLDRVFFLRNNYLPQKSFGHWHNGDIQLTSGSPHTVVWPTV